MIAAGPPGAAPDVQQARDMLAELAGEEREPRAWMVRGSSVNGKNLVPTWLAKGTCSIPASQIRSLPLPVTRAEVAAIVEEDYAQKSYTTRTEKVAEIDTFVNRVRIGDLVATNSGPDLFVGTVTSEPVALGEDGRPIPTCDAVCSGTTRGSPSTTRPSLNPSRPNCPVSTPSST